MNISFDASNFLRANSMNHSIKQPFSSQINDKSNDNNSIAVTANISKSGIAMSKNHAQTIALSESVHDKMETLEENSENLSDDKPDYKSMIEQLRKNLTKLNKNTTPQSNETIDEERRKAMVELQALIEEAKVAYEERENQAKEIAASSSEQETKLQHDSGELLMLAETLKAQNEDTDNTSECKQNTKDSNSKNEEENQNAVSDTLYHLSDNTSREAYKKEIKMEDTIEDIHDSAKDHLKQSHELGQMILDQIDTIDSIVSKANYSDEEKAMVFYGGASQLKEAFKEMATNRGFALTELQNVRDLHRVQKENQNMYYAHKSSDTIDSIASEVMVHEKIQDVVPKMEQEKEQVIQDKIDEIQNKEQPNTESLKNENNDTINGILNPDDAQQDNTQSQNTTNLQNTTSLQNTITNTTLS